MKERKWLMPSYYKDFKCKCDKCRHNCCSTWKIPVSKDEYYKLINMDCNSDLRKRIDVAFVDPPTVSEDRYKYITFNWQGNCPINKDGLCMIHAQAGESHLPKVCRLFPRSLKQINNFYIACCSSSCEAVVEAIFKDKKLHIVEDTLYEEPSLKYELSQDAYKEIIQYNDILKDRSTSLVESIIDICKQVDEKTFLEEYEKDDNPLDVALSLLNRFSDSDNFLSEINNEIQNRYKENYQQFDIDKKLFENTYPEWMYLFEGVLNNSLLYENFPFVDERFSKVYAYKGLCASYGLLRLVSIGYTSMHKGDDYFIDVVAELFHLIDHTAFYYNVNVVCNNAACLLKI